LPVLGCLKLAIFKVTQHGRRSSHSLSTLSEILKNKEPFFTRSNNIKHPISIEINNVKENTATRSNTCRTIVNYFLAKDSPFHLK